MSPHILESERYFLIRQPGLEQEGPFTSQELLALVRGGLAGPHSLYWHEQAEDWQPVDEALIRHLTRKHRRPMPLWIPLLAMVFVVGAVGVYLAVRGPEARRPAPAQPALAPSATPTPEPTAPATPSPTSTPAPSPAPAATPAPSPTPLPNLSVNEIARKLHPSVAVVKVYDGRNKFKNGGTGWVMSEDGLFVTSYGFVNADYNITITLPDRPPIRPVGLVYSDRRKDFVVFRLPKGHYEAPPLRPANEPPIAGEGVVVCGNALGYEGSISKGVVSAVRPSNAHTDLIQISAPVSPGAGGSPVTDQQGRVMGMASFSKEDGQALGFCVEVSDVSKALARGDFKEIDLVEVQARLERRMRTTADLDARIAKARPEEYPGLLAEVDAAVAQFPDDLVLAYLVGDMYVKLGHKDRAVALYEKWLAKDPEKEEILLAYYAICSDPSEDQKAADLARKIVKLNPKSAMNWVNLGMALGLLGKEKEALEAYEQALERDPKQTAALCAIGRIKCAQNKSIDGIPYLKKAIALDPEDDMAILDLMDAFRRLGKFAEAAELGENLVKLLPEDPYMWDMLGLCQDLSGKSIRAVECELKAIALRPKVKKYWENLAVFYQKAGRSAESARAAQKASQLPPEPKPKPYSNGYRIRPEKAEAVTP